MPASKCFSQNFLFAAGLLASCIVLASCSHKPKSSNSKIQSLHQAKSSNSPKPQTDSPVGLPFTVDNFFSQELGLKPMESLGEFKDSHKFSSDFLDGKGTITGEYLKNTRKLHHISIVGEGPTWDECAAKVAFLSFSSRDKAIETIKKLFSSAESKISKDGIRFQYFQNGKIRFLIVDNVNDTQKLRESVAENYIVPNVGITLSQFRKAFNSRIHTLAPRLEIRGNGEETTTPSYFQYEFSSDTVLNINADESEMLIQTVSVRSATW